MTQPSQLETLWQAVWNAGGIDAYVDRQMREHGFLVERRETDAMSEREKKRYKAELKKEAAERRRLRQEAWAAKKANEIIHLGEHVFWSDAVDFDRFDLSNAEERAAENALPRLDKPADLARALDISVADLRWFTYHREAALASGVHYKRFVIPKRDGSERAIWAPLPRLKKIQRWILREIVERLPIHGAAHGFVPLRSIATHAAIHTNAKIVAQMDVRDFFPTVTLPRVKGLFRHAGYRERIATLLALLCTEAPREVVEHDGQTWYIALGPRCLPQGAPTSPALTNVLCLKLDRRLTGLAARSGWRYSRYADDLTFSLPSPHSADPKTGLLMGSVGRIVQDEGFVLHAKKTRISRHGSQQKVTGLIVNGEGAPRTPRDLRRRIRAALHNLLQGKELREGESLEMLAGYASYIFMTDPELGGKLLAELASLRESH